MAATFEECEDVINIIRSAHEANRLPELLSKILGKTAALVILITSKGDVDMVANVLQGGETTDRDSIAVTRMGDLLFSNMQSFFSSSDSGVKELN